MIERPPRSTRSIRRDLDDAHRDRRFWQGMGRPEQVEIQDENIAAFAAELREAREYERQQESRDRDLALGLSGGHLRSLHR